MRRAGINQVRKRKLMDITKALKWSRVNHAPLVGADADKRMNRIAKLVVMFFIFASLGMRENRA